MFQSAYACDKDIKILENFKHFTSVMCNESGSSHEVLQQTGLAQGIMDSLITSIWL